MVVHQAATNEWISKQLQRKKIHVLFGQKDRLFKKNKIWHKISNDMGIKFDSEPKKNSDKK